MPAEEQYKGAITSHMLKAMMEDGYKTVYILDGVRYSEVYEAPVNADIGDPCIRTKLKYSDGAGGTSPIVIAQEEEVVGWPGYELIQVGAANDIDNVL